MNAAVEQYTSFSSNPFPVTVVVVVVVFCAADLEEEEEGFAVEAPEAGFGPCAIGKAVNDSEGDKVRGRVEGASKLAAKVRVLVSLSGGKVHLQKREEREPALPSEQSCPLGLTLCTHKRSPSPSPYRRDPLALRGRATHPHPSPVRYSQSCARPRRRVSLGGDRAQKR